MQYSSIVRRLEAYRKKYHIPQEKLASQLDITQSQYSKIELGKIKLSFGVLEKLYGFGWDIDDIVIGLKSDKILPFLREEFAEADREQFISGMKLCEWAIWRWNQNDKKTAGIGWKLLNAYVNVEDALTPLEKLRRVCDISQVRMAEIAGVNIKKYCAIEKGERQLDAELLANIYKETDCRPTFFMNERLFYLTVVSKECGYKKEREKQLKELLQIRDKFV